MQPVPQRIASDEEQEFWFANHPARNVNAGGQRERRGCFPQQLLSGLGSLGEAEAPHTARRTAQLFDAIAVRGEVLERTGRGREALQAMTGVLKQCRQSLDQRVLEVPLLRERIRQLERQIRSLREELRAKQERG